MTDFLTYLHHRYTQPSGKIQEAIGLSMRILHGLGNPAEVSPVAAEAVTQAGYPFPIRATGGMGRVPLPSFSRNSRLLRNWDGL